MLTQQEQNEMEEQKMRFISPEDYEPKVCEKCSGRNVYSTTPKELIDGLCPSCVVSRNSMVKESRENKNQTYEAKFPQKLHLPIPEI